MPVRYRLANPGITSVSLDGREHHVHDGVLHVEDEHHSPALARNLKAEFGAELHEPDETQVEADRAEEDERQVLFSRLDVALNRKLDRRTSIQQLRKLAADHDRRLAARIEPPA